MTRTPLSTSLDAYEVWFVTGSQTLYGEETLRQVAEQSQAVAAGLDGLPVKVVWKPVLKDADSIRRLALEVNTRDDVVGVIAWMHTFSPAKMWIAGLDALQKPLLHLHTQANVELPWADIDFDFMNLNQAAHGDREFGYIQTRLGIARKTVVGHVSNPAVAAADRGLAARRRRLGRLAVAQARPLRRQHALRRRDRGRQDRGRAAIRRAGQHVGRERARRRGRGCRRMRMSTPSSPSTSTRTTSRTSSSRAPTVTSRCATARRSSWACARSSRRAASAPSPPRSKTSAPSSSCPGLAVQRLMAEGYGFGAEGDWKTAILVRVANVMGAGLPGGASLMEDYTYDLVPGSERILGAHMLEVSPSLTTAKPRLEVHALGIGGKEDPVRLVFTADPGPALVVALSDMRDRFRLVANVVENVDAPDLPKLPVGRAVWKPAPDFATSASCWLAAGAAHHTVMTTAVGIEVFRDFAEIAKTELVVIDEDTTVRGFQRELRWNQAYYRLAQGI